MSSQISSFFSSAPSTSRLEAPEEVQRACDFESTRTEALLDEEVNTEIGLELNRLLGYDLSRDKKKLRSFIWLHGWRLLNDKGHEHWVCRKCHTGPLKPKKPKGHLFRTTAQTSGPIYHLRDQHGIVAPGATPVRKAPTTPLGSQRSITGFTSSSTGVCNSDAPFDYDVFKGLLLQLFTTRPVSLALVEDEAFRSLLIYCQPVLHDCIPSRRSLRRYIEATYNSSLTTVKSHLQSATTKINLSFDLWTSPGHRLSLLGVVAHYLDASFTPRVVLLALPRMQGAHTAVNLSEQLSSILRYFKLEDAFGHAITDNASENAACLDLLSNELLINMRKRHVRCIGHIINLVAQQVLFGSDVESFEESITNVTAVEVELHAWRQKGPIGRLHNLIRYICASEPRRSLFLQVQREQPEAMQSERLRSQDAYELKHDNLTRWNSWYDAAERALDLRYAVDDTVDRELEPYYQKLARFNMRNTSQLAIPPKEPILLLDRLNNDDWQIIASYLKLLKPLKDATMKLQGNVNTTSKHGRPVKGAIWQVLPIFEEMLRAFEEARKRYQPSSQYTSQPTQSQATPSEQPQGQRNTRKGKRQACLSDSRSTESAAVGTDEVIAPEHEYNDQGVYFSTAINAGWQKLEHYYNQSDVTPIHRAAVLLHPRMKWRWFEKYWRSKPEWIEDARGSITELWITPIPTILQDEWSSLGTDDLDQLQLYELEPYTEDYSAFDSPIPYWLNKRAIWPQLAQMALDIYSTPAMSDEPERVFSVAGNVLAPSRRRLTSEVMQWLLCLRSWQKSEIIKLDQRLLRAVVIQVDSLPLPPLLDDDEDDDEDDDSMDEIITPEIV
ncbi:hypothetical protein Q7P35_002900 [Cladosporium inversicolor]